MTAQELEKELSLGYTDWEFVYKDKRGTICPFNKEGGFYAAVVYDGQNFEFHSLEELMHSPFIGGKSLSQVAATLDVYS